MPVLEMRAMQEQQRALQQNIFRKRAVARPCVVNTEVWHSIALQRRQETGCIPQTSNELLHMFVSHPKLPPVVLFLGIRFTALLDLQEALI